MELFINFYFIFSYGATTNQHWSHTVPVINDKTPFSVLRTGTVVANIITFRHFFFLILPPLWLHLNIIFCLSEKFEFTIKKLRYKSEARTNTGNS